MAKQTERTTLQNSITLQNAMRARGYNAFPGVGDIFYEPDGTLHLGVMISGGGLLETIANGATFSELFDQNDPTLIKAWRILELEPWVQQHVISTQTTSTVTAGITKYTITVGGKNYSGQNASPVIALSNALAKILDPTTGVSDDFLVKDVNRMQ